MFKNILKITLLIGLLFVTGCTNTSYVKEISYNEFKSKIENKESFVLEIMSSDCTACVSFGPKLKKVTSDYKITVYQVNTSKLSEEDANNIYDTYYIEGTPTTIFFTEGKEISQATRINGNTSEDKIISKLKSMGYIK